MQCTRPLIGYYSKNINLETGKRSIVFKRSEAVPDQEPLTLSCGKCTACRLRYARNWAIRCSHEAKMNEDNAYITLTYDDAHLPHIADKKEWPSTLRLEDWQKFMKRLRKRYGDKIKFFHCGEYGDDYGRPHYHACLFGIDWTDKKEWEKKGKHTLYTSAQLQWLWPYGHCTSGAVTFASAAYVARYILKKMTGPLAKKYQYKLKSGEVLHRKAEYTTNSNEIGKSWFDKWHAEIYPADYLIISGKKVKPPPYYDHLLEKRFPLIYKDVMEKRRYENTQRIQEAGSNRLSQMEKAHEGHTQKRSLGEEK